MANQPPLYVTVTHKGRGAVARILGKDIKDNPHPVDTEEWRDWLEGWTVKDREIAARSSDG